MRAWGAVRAAAYGAAAAVLLSGCIKLDIDLTVRSDDKVDGTFIVGVSKEVAALMPGGIANLDQLITNGEQPQINGAEDVQTAPYEDDQFIGQQVTFTGAPLEEAGSGPAGSTGELSIKHDGDRYRLSGTLDLTTGDLSNLPGDVTQNIDTQQLFSQAVVRVHVTFPGRVEESNGEVSGCSVTWQPKFGTSSELSAVAHDSGSCREGLRWWAWPLFGLGLLVLIGAVIAIIHLLRKERRGRSGGEAAAAATAATLAPPSGQALAPPSGEGMAPPSGEALAPPSGGALAAPSGEAAAAPPGEGLAPPPTEGLAPPSAEGLAAPDEAAADTGWPPPGSNLPPPPDSPAPSPPDAPRAD